MTNLNVEKSENKERWHNPADVSRKSASSTWSPPHPSPPGLPSSQLPNFSGSSLSGTITSSDQQQNIFRFLEQQRSASSATAQECFAASVVSASNLGHTRQQLNYQQLHSNSHHPHHTAGHSSPSNSPRNDTCSPSSSTSSVSSNSSPDSPPLFPGCTVSLSIFKSLPTSTSTTSLNSAFGPPGSSISTFNANIFGSLMSPWTTPHSVAPSTLPTSSASGIPNNCSDIIRNMAAKYNKLEQYNAALSHLRQITSTSEDISNSRQRNTLPSISSFNSRSDSQSMPQQLFGSSQDNVSSILGIHPLSIDISLPRSVDLQVAGKPIINAPLQLPTHSSEVSSAQLLLSMVKNAAAKRHEQEHLVDNGVRYSEVVSEPMENCFPTGLKRPGESITPLDLSASPPLDKRQRLESEEIDIEGDFKSEPPTPVEKQFPASMNDAESVFSCNSTTADEVSAGSCHSGYPMSNGDPTTWSVDDVYNFVKSIDICEEYAEDFKSQMIDGWCLSLLTEAHLISSLRMKLGPALKLLSLMRVRSGCPHQCSASSSSTEASSNGQETVVTPHEMD